MSRGGPPSIHPWSFLAIAVAVAGAGLDALPSALLLNAPAYESSRDEADDLDDIEDVSWLESSPGTQLRRRGTTPAWDASPLAPSAPPASTLAMTRTPRAGLPVPRTSWPCRLRC